MHNCWFRTRNLVHTFLWHYHCTASVNTSVLLFSFIETIYIRFSSLLLRVTWRLVSDVRRGTRGAARAGHDVAGPGLDLNLPIAQVRCTACFEAAMWRRTEARLRNRPRLDSWPVAVQ